MAKKRKSQSKKLSNLHFITSLQLEQALEVIGSIADETHQVTVTEVTDDEYNFEIEYFEEKRRLAHVKGSLQRWLGTETKLDADGDVYRLEISNDHSSNAVMMHSFIIIMMGVGISAATGIPFLAVPFFFGGIGYGYQGLHQNLDESKDIPTVLFRHRDYLLQLLIDRFQAVGNVRAVD